MENVLNGCIITFGADLCRKIEPIVAGGGWQFGSEFQAKSAIRPAEAISEYQFLYWTSATSCEVPILVKKSASDFDGRIARGFGVWMLQKVGMVSALYPMSIWAQKL